MQIDEIRVVSESRPTFEQEMESLRRENSALKGQIEEWKAKLSRVESEHGVPQINSPAANTNGHEKAAPTPTKPAPAAAANQAKDGGGDAPKSAEKSGKKKGGKGGGGGGGGGGDKKEEGPVDVGRLDMRVGLITTAKKHPDADRYGSEVEVDPHAACRLLLGDCFKLIGELSQNVLELKI